MGKCELICRNLFSDNISKEGISSVSLRGKKITKRIEPWTG